MVKHFHNDEDLQTELNALKPKNTILINILIKAWNDREPPTLTERDIIELNRDYNAGANRDADNAARDFDPYDRGGSHKLFVTCASFSEVQKHK